MRVGARHRMLVGGVAACACALAAAQAAPAVTTTPRIVGGAAIPITQAPWQVAIVKHATANAYGGQFCGGAILDATHIVTAAHCLDIAPVNPDGSVGDGQNENAATRDVVAGTALLNVTTGGMPAGSQRIQLATWSGMPSYDPLVGTDDVAVAQLSQALDFSTPQIQPAPLVASADRTPAGAPLTVSGWGLTATNGSASTLLRAVDILATSDTSCADWFAPDFDPDSMLCAIAPGKDSCNGDSGGPLTRLDGTLVGLVSSGPPDCASPNGAPGIYAELADPLVAAWVRAFVPGPAYSPPTPATAPALAGTAASGQALTCTPGTWTGGVPGEPLRDYRFQSTTGVTLRGWDPNPAYTLLDADAGLRVVCIERARDAGGAGLAASAPGDPVVGPPAPPAGPPATPAPQPAPQPVAPKDTTAPRGSIISTRCVRGRCIVRVRASDPGTAASGVRAVRVTVLPARGRTRTISARRIATGVYEARFTKVARGTCWFTVTTSDVAGNRSPEPAIRHVRVR